MSDNLSDIQKAVAQIKEILERVQRKQLTLNGKYVSSCCGKPTILVRSREGGFVTQNCSRCGVPKSIRLDELPQLICTRCKGQLLPFKRQNYMYECAPCGVEWELAQLVPPWHELFDECGYYLDSDGVASGYNSFVDHAAIQAMLRRGKPNAS